MTSLQRQAVLVCVVCALAALLTVGITLTLLKRGKPETPGTPADSVPTDTTGDGESTDLANHYQIDNTSSALLTETADAGTEYLDSTLFLGDSNTVRLYNNGLISLQQFCAKEGIGTHAALNEGIVTFKKDSSTYTIAQAVAKMKPRRVVIMLGTNDCKTVFNVTASDIARGAMALIRAVRAFPWTDAAPCPRILLMAPIKIKPQIADVYMTDFDERSVEASEHFGEYYAHVAEQFGCDFFNAAEFAEPGDIDYLHMMPESHESLGHAVAAKLQEMLGE